MPTWPTKSIGYYFRLLLAQCEKVVQNSKMINKIRDLIKKLRSKKKNSEDMNADDLTSDIPVQQNKESTDELNLDTTKFTFKEKLHNLKTLLSDKFSKLSFRRKKTLSIPKANVEVDEKPKRKKSASSINLIQVEDFFFKKKHQNSLHKFFQVFIIFLLVFTIGKVTALILKDKAQVGSLDGQSITRIDTTRNLQAKTIDQIRNQNLFNTGKVEKLPTNDKPDIKAELACLKADRKSNLPIKLINTVVLQDSVKSIASVQVRSESLFRELRVGEKINDMAKIDKIERLKLIVKNLKTGSCESIESSAKDNDIASPIRVMSKSQSKAYKKSLKPISGIKNDGNKFVIEKSFLQDKMKNIGQVLTEAVGTQINNPDGSISFKITNITPGSVFSYLGINDNDVITGIGGEKITDLNAVMSLFGKLKSLDQTSITVKRGGAQVTQEYKFQ